MTDLLDSLPDRPLSLTEADGLVEQDVPAVPLEFIPEDARAGPGRGVYTLQVTPPELNRSHVVGYAQSAGGWVRVETWDVKNWSVEKQDGALDRWLTSECPE